MPLKIRCLPSESTKRVSNVEIFSAEKPATLDAVTAFGEVVDPYADLHYQWYCDNVAVEGATEKTLEATVAGDYSVGVVNHWNKAVLEEVKSSNIIQLYPAAIVPEIVSFEAHPNNVWL